ncbi:MAG: Rrf2 family transcriptional regulator [Deltaproteobacteria bacterium]|nr:Rrf2 family transcriptional regulator [Deltaproteobacteria bacterium]
MSHKNTGLHPTERSSLMNIGKRVDYAIRALSYLAARPENHAVSRREIQEKQDIPAHFLSKIMKRLETGGLVQSYMGARGGFALKKLPAHITLKEVYECLEGPLLLMGCLDERERACRYCSVCSQISVWHEAQRLLANYLAGVTIQQLANKVGLRDELASWSREESRPISVH